MKSIDIPLLRRLGLAALFFITQPLSIDLPAAAARDSKAAAPALGRMPVHFIENIGQVDSSVRYYVLGSDKSLYFTSDGLTLAIAQPAAGATLASAAASRG